VAVKLLNKLSNIENLKKKIRIKKSEYLSRTRVKYTAVSGEANGQKRLIFVLPVLHYPCGGNIVTHNKADAINTLQYQNTLAEVMYPQELDFSPTLFPYTSPIKRDLNIALGNDFVIVPEAFVMINTPSLIEQNIPYAINVLNGYLMDLEIIDDLGTFDELSRAYRHAKFIISISEDTTENIKLVFPECADKIIQASYVIDKAKQIPLEQKENIITYMPRKLSRHSQLVLFMLGKKLPPHWRLVPIDGVTEAEVYTIFTRSKIFLSFSEFEGLAMPPVMAALSGNLVIGYTGEGNKEYFHLPCFEEVMSGDLKAFVDKLLKATERFDQAKQPIDQSAIAHLAERFSHQRLKSFLKTLIDRANMHIHMSMMLVFEPETWLVWSII
jgi:hypothetical protein